MMKAAARQTAVPAQVADLSVDWLEVTRPITNSYATGAVRGNGVGFNQGVGGFAGVTNSSISETYATGAVVGGDGADAIGGLTGRVIGASASRSYATGTVDDGDDADNDPTTPEDDDTADNIGGLVGLVVGTINDSYYSGEVGTITDGDVSDTGDLESLALDAAVIPRRTPEILRATSTNVGILQRMERRQLGLR